MTNKTVRALGLCSGGLDSILAGLVLEKQGIKVEWISFETPFFSATKARLAAQQTGIRLHTQNITKIYLEMLKNPSCGYGKYMNPCIDCHTLMFNLAGKIMQQEKFDFLFSGEVLGQRPMSQTRPSLRYVEKNSGCDGYILRPLSALKMQPTIPEQRGLVDREKLFGITGRSRKLQIQLAAQYKITQYPSPAGGCLLTDKNFSRRLGDLFAHQEYYSEKELNLLKFGRHMRLNNDFKIIVGRTQKDNENIISQVDPKKNLILKPATIPGPIVVIDIKAPDKIIQLAASICVGYTKAPSGEKTRVEISKYKNKTTLSATSLTSDQIMPYLI